MTDKQTATYGWSQDSNLSLQVKLKEDLKVAMRNKDHAVRDAIRMVISEFPKLTVPITLESGKKSFRVKKSDEITDEDILGLIGGLIKSEKSVLELKKESESEYLRALESYLPRMAGREEITAWVQENIDFSAYKSPMQAMGTIMKHFGKTADGNLVKSVLQEMIKK